MGTCRTAASGAERRRQCGLQLKEERIKERYEKGAARSQLKVANTHTHSTLLSRTNTHTHTCKAAATTECMCVCVCENCRHKESTKMVFKNCYSRIGTEEQQ